jgi:hypothetical protein
MSCTKMTKIDSVAVNVDEYRQTKRTSGNTNSRVLRAGRKKTDKYVSPYKIKGYQKHVLIFS